MAEVRKTIGSHPSREYSVITLWEADLDNTEVYSVGDDAVGECYNDSTFNEAVNIDGGSILGLNSITLTVADGEKHNGTNLIGVQINGYDTGASVLLNLSSSVPTTVEWLIVRDLDGPEYRYGIIVDVSVDVNLRNLIVCNIGGVDQTHDAYGIYGVINNYSSTATLNILNCIVYSIYSSHHATGIYAGSWWSNVCNVYNCTVFAIGAGTVYEDGYAYGYELVDHTEAHYNNLISLIGFTNINDATYNYCFNPSSFSNATVGYNMSSDATASGIGSLINQENVSDDQVRMTYHGLLKDGSSAINAGVDLEISPTNVNIDITQYDRNAGGDVWDMGAHEYVLSGYIGLYIEGYGLINDSIDLFIKGNIAAELPLYVYGYGVLTDNIDLCVSGHESNNSNIDLYTSGYLGDIDKNIFLYTEGYAYSDNSYINLFTYGVTTEGASGISGSIPLIVYDSGTVNLNITLFIQNLQTEVPYTEDLNLFIGGGYATFTGNIPLYVCQEGVYGDFTLFVRGEGTYIGCSVDNDSLPLYIYRPNISTIVPLFLCNTTQESNSYVPLYMSAILGTLTADLNLSIPNVHIADNSYVELYMLGTVSSTGNVDLVIPNTHATINDNIPLFISHRGALDNLYMSLYSFGAYLDNASLDLVMPDILAELNDNTILYVHGY